MTLKEAINDYFRAQQAICNMLGSERVTVFCDGSVFIDHIPDDATKIVIDVSDGMYFDEYIAIIDDVEVVHYSEKRDTP